MSGMCCYYKPGASGKIDSVRRMCAVMKRPGSGHRVSVTDGKAALGCVAPEADASPGRSVFLVEDGELKVLYSGDTPDMVELSEALDAEGLGSAASVEEALTRLCGKDPSCALKALGGGFAITVWDGRKNRLSAATDRFGIEPVYYLESAGGVILSTSLRAITTHKGAAAGTIDLNALYHYLNFYYVPHPYAIFSGIKKLSPGCMLTVEGGSLKVAKYWDIDYTESQVRDEGYYVDNIERLLGRAVSRSLSTAVPHERTGAFLSGGTDSSTIVGVMSSVIDAPAETFSIGFSEDGYNELKYARIAAEHFGTNHHEYTVRPSDLMEAIPPLVSSYQEPFGNSSAIATYFCAKIARRENVRMLIAGDGGDEIFGGNERYLKNKIFNMYHTLPRMLREDVIETLIKVLPGGSLFFNRVRNFTRRANLHNPERHYTDDSFASDFFDEMLADAVAGRLDRNASLEVLKEIYDEAKADREFNKLLYMDLMTAIAGNDLVKVTTACMANDVSVRFPMLDKDLVAFSATIPVRLKLKGFDKRYIFKKYMKGFVPDDIIKKTKHGFGLPFDLWVREDRDIREMAFDLLLSRRSLERGYFNKAFLEDLLGRHISGQWFFGNEIWALIMLELWHREHMDR